MYSSRTYQENYFQNRKKILEEFWKDEENETLKYIDDIEQLVSSTKTVLKGLVSGELDYDTLKEQLTAMEHDLSNECESLEQDITTLTSVAKSTERITNDLNKQEEKNTKHYLGKIEDLKKDLEIKEFKIQNMERLYVELENIIKENIRTGSDQLLTLEQFSQFAAQNDQLREEIEALEEEKKQCLEDYNNLLRENLNVRSKDESFELEKIKDALEEISTMGTLQKEAEQRINKLQDRFKNLNKECNTLTNQVKDITKSLESLNIDNVKLNREIALINKELHPNKKRLNRSFTETTKEDSEFNSQLEEDNKKTKHMKHKSNFAQL
jgi:chromosome segregation ATPase